jgi:hypothetical protein
MSLMTVYEKLKQKPGAFKRLSGITIAEFGELYQELRPTWRKMERKRLNRPGRQRTIGGGRNYTLTFEDRLLMTLFWLHLQLNTTALGFCFGVNKSTVSRNSNSILPALRQVGNETRDWPEPPKRGQGKTIEQAWCDYPDLAMIVEAPRLSHDGQQPAHSRQQLVPGDGKHSVTNVQRSAS